MKLYDLGKSKVMDWIRAHANYQGDECLHFPFARDLRGYGIVGGPDKKILRAHRVMCFLAHGEPPTPAHHAAHSCGCGSDGCINPNHLDWKTASENQFDRRKHGTHGSGAGKRGHLTPDDVRQIRALRGKVTQRKLAARFKVSDATIRGVQSHRWWRHVS